MVFYLCQHQSLTKSKITCIHTKLKERIKTQSDRKATLMAAPMEIEEAIQVLWTQKMAKVSGPRALLAGVVVYHKEESSIDKLLAIRVAAR